MNDSFGETVQYIQFRTQFIASGNMNNAPANAMERGIQLLIILDFWKALIV